MAGGWSRDGAVQDQINASVEDEVQRARSRLPHGESLTHCEECGDAIPKARTTFTGFNRRGSKDSQLK